MAKSHALIGYVRVSTGAQGRSGLGIEAQREALARFAATEGFELERIYTEMEQGFRCGHLTLVASSGARLL
jgi:DNA invertase Pin-like site-specific DNA recombinase